MNDLTDQRKETPMKIGVLLLLVVGLAVILAILKSKQGSPSSSAT